MRLQSPKLLRGMQQTETQVPDEQVIFIESKTKTKNCVQQTNKQTRRQQTK